MRIRIAVLASLCLALGMAVAVAGREDDGGPGRLEPQGTGLQTATFDTLSGTVTVYLPEEIAAGDAISGTVTTEPAGDNDKKREKNRGTLSGYVLEVDEERPDDEREKVGDGRFAVRLPGAPDRDDVVRLVLREVRKGKPGREIGSVDIPLRDPSSIPDGYRLPDVAQAGRPAVVRGAFDGDLSTTGLTLGNVEALPLAESPRMAVFRSPQEIVGVSPAALREQGETVAEGEVRSVAVALSAPKLNLMKGETTTLTTVVTGLEELRDEIPFELDVWPAAVVAVEGGNRHDRVIRPEDVGDDGAYRFSLRVTGRTAGGWNAEATVRVPESRPAERFALVIEGEPVGWIEVVRREPIVFEAGLGLGRPLYDWIERSFDGTRETRNGRIAGCDRDGAEVEADEFRNAIIESVAFPDLDPDRDDPANMTITLASETVSHERGSGKRVDVPPENGNWLRSSFRFELGGLSVERVSKIDAFTWRRSPSDGPASGAGARRESAAIETSDLDLTVSTTDVDSWELWHRAFSKTVPETVSRRGPAGRLVLLGPDGVEPLARIEFRQATMASLDVGQGDDHERAITIELRTDKATFEREAP